MPDLADLYPAFAQRRIGTAAGEIIDSDHFLTEENPDAAAQALADFFK